jgi:ribulose-5-phosphate 4-epimerase/fuculose-1-phosphate aldolase
MDNYDIFRDTLETFCDGCYRVSAHHLMRCSSGNVSVRMSDEEHMLISASGSWLDGIEPEQVTLCRIIDGAVVEGPKPSVESVFHAGILAARPDVNVVLHFQTPFATTLATRAPIHREYFVIPEIPVNIGPIGIVDFIPPGTDALARAVVSEMKTHNLVQLANHGQVTCGQDFKDVILKAVFFELACELIVRNGDQTRYLTDTEVETIIHG